MSVQLLDKALFQATVDGGKHWVCCGSAREPSGWSSSHSYPPSPAGQLTGECKSKQVEEPLPEGPLPRHNPSEWNQSSTMHPTVASKRSLRLSLSRAHRGVPLWRPSHLKSAASHWQDKVSLNTMLMYSELSVQKKCIVTAMPLCWFVWLNKIQICIVKSGHVPC